MQPRHETVAVTTNTDSIVWDIWKGYPSKQYVRNQCESILEIINNSQAHIVCTDLRQARGTFIHSIKYLQGYFKQLKFFGVNKMAYLLPKDQELIVKAAELSLIDNFNVEFQFFYEEEEALIWLNNLESLGFQHGLTNCGKLVVNKDRQNVFIPMSEINFIAADGHNCNVYSLKDVYRINSSLKEVNKILPNIKFQRIHKSYIVNTARIRKVSGETPYSYILLMEGLSNIKIPIGKKYLQNCKRILGMRS